jgi:hypothetical protein
MIGLALLPVLLYLLHYAAKKRATLEAGKIKASSEELSFWWHVEMFVTGKAPAIIGSTLVYGLATWSVYGLAAMGLLGAVWYSYWFDQYLSLARSYPRWYISFDQHTALTDKLLREVMWRMKWTPEQTHKRVRVPLMVLGIILCVIVAIL